MRAHCVTVTNPFDRFGSRAVREITAPGPIRALAPKTRRPFIITRNGSPVLRADWDEPVRDGDLFAVVCLPQGGGDGGGSNPMRIVLMIAMNMIMPGVGQFIGGQLGLNLATNSFAYMAVNTVSSLVGMALVNAIVPPPKAPTPQQAATLAAPSPTYSMQAQGNMARLEQAIPEQFGRIAAYPDLAAQPYIEYAGNEQYVYQLLCLGRGEYDIEAIRIEDTPIANFSEITHQVVAPGGSLTLFPANVVTSGEVAGQEILGTALGPYVASAAGTEANWIGIDLIMPRGLYHYTAGGVESMSLSVVIEARAIDANGAPTGCWATLGTETITDQTTTPQRVSRRYPVTPGRYEVRATRTDTKQTDSAYGHEVLWGGLRAYLPETGSFGDVTLIAMRMRASNNLSAQASRRVNVIATRKLPIWNGSTWSAPTATHSIAWAWAYVAKRVLPDTRIDLAGLLALDAIWTARGDEFNGRFDNAMLWWEALTKIAQVGRAQPFMQGGVLRVARDGPQTVPVAMFSMRNIVAGSFSIDYLMPTDDTADAVKATYFDSTGWAPRTVEGKLPDSVAALPAKIDLTVGVTSRAQAHREAIYQAASNRYRRRAIKFSTEMEGFIPSKLDLIAIQHDLVAWGQHGEAVEWDADTKTLTVSEPLPWGSGPHYVGLRKRDGGVAGPYPVSQGTAAEQMIFATAPDPAPYTGRDYERTHVSFGPASDTYAQLAKVVRVRPRGLYQVEIEAVVEDQSVHTAENGQVAPPVRTSQLQTRYTAPRVENLTMRSSPSDASQALLTWTPAPGADYYQIEMAAGDDPYAPDVSWTRVGEPTANNYAVAAIYGAQTMIRVRAVGLAVGPWVSMFYGADADYFWAPGVDPMWTPDTDLMWR